MLYFTESSLALEADLVGDDKLPTVVFDVGHFLHILLLLDVDV